MTLSKARAFRFEQGSVRMLPGKSRKMLNWTMLALESNRVIGLRLAKLMRGGKGAQREAKRMVREKIQAAAKAGANLMAGASSDEICASIPKAGGGKRKAAGPAAKTMQTKILTHRRLVHRFVETHHMGRIHFC
jgi:hypothetical protein